MKMRRRLTPLTSPELHLVTALTNLMKYWPSVVAALQVAYVIASGNKAQIAPAIAALLATFGVNQSAIAAHAQLAALQHGK